MKDSVSIGDRMRHRCRAGDGRAGDGRAPSPVIGAVAMLAAGAVMVAGCASDTNGSARRVDASAAAGSSASSAMDRFALSPNDFPSTYPATRLTGAPASEAMADVTGRPISAQIVPQSCLPQQVPSGRDDAVVLVGQSAAGANLTLITVRVAASLGDLSTQLARCGSYTVIDGPARSAVTVEVLPPSPVASDTSLAYRRTLRQSTAPGAPAQITTTLVAQTGDIRVYAEYRSAKPGPPDGAVLDELFTAAVTRSRGR